MAESFGVGLIGCGTVGTGVVRILTDYADRLARRSGRKIVLRHIVVSDATKARDPNVPAALLRSSISDVLADDSVEVVVELIGGTTTARTIVLAALAAKKHVVTANKALLAEHGPELFAAARAVGRAICFEAAVAGGVPIIRVLAESLAANQIVALQGILNGTSNYILTRMADDGDTYEAALADAQRLGYAEADPTLDVDGSDAAHKLAVLAQIAFGVTPNHAAIERRGIAAIDALDMRFAKELGYTIKLLAEAWITSGSNHPDHGPTLGVSLHVAPVLLRTTDMLAQVRGAFNAIQVIGDVVGETLYQGPGAGMMPTASSVVSDIIDLAVGRGQHTFAAANLWSTPGNTRFELTTSEELLSRFYLRLVVQDEPGALADVCRTLAEHQISILSVIQHEPHDDHPERTVPLVIMTHEAETGTFRTAIAAIAQLSRTVVPPVYFPVDS